ncbi:MAG TPA: ABC transporter permease [Gaiellaceae bacterium]
MSAHAGTAQAARRTKGSLLKRLVYERDVTFNLVRTELASRQRGSFLGWLWSLGPPFLQLAATYFLFTRVIPLGIDNFPVFLLVGVLAWSWFSGSVSEATSSLEARRDLVLRPGFTTAVIPLVAVLVALVDYVLALPVLFIALGFTTGIHVEAFFLPVLLALQLGLCAGLSLLFAPLQVFVRDVQRIVSVGLAVLFWFTPVFYERKQVPGALEPLYRLNPMSELIEAQRAILLDGSMPTAKSVGLVVLETAIALALGIFTFVRLRHSVPDEL